MSGVTLSALLDQYRDLAHFAGVNGSSRDILDTSLAKCRAEIEQQFSILQRCVQAQGQVNHCCKSGEMDKNE